MTGYPRILFNAATSIWSFSRQDNVYVVGRADEAVQGNGDAAHYRKVNAAVGERDQQFFELEIVLRLGWRRGHVCR